MTDAAAPSAPEGPSGAPATDAPFPPATRAEKLAWCGFDFSNSAFTTIVVTVVYPLYFNKVVVGDPLRGEILWGHAQTLSQLCVLLLAPILGAIADARAAKKRLLAATWLLCSGGTALLTVAGGGDVALAWTTFVVANVAFAAGENLVAGFLPELAGPAEAGRLSGLGWAIGYFGGLASLGFALALSKSDLTRWIPLATAAFMLLAGIPTFALLRERARPKPRTAPLLRAAFADATLAWRDRRRFPDLRRLLLALFFAQAGVVVVIAFASLYGAQEFGLTEAELIVLFIVLQLAASVGAAGFGRWQDRRGSKPALGAAVALWIVAVLLAVFARNRETFYVAAALSGAAMGGSQATGRAMVGLFAPEGRAGAWFGLWGLATKAAGVVGPLAFTLALGSVGRRPAMLSTVAFFVAGLVALRTVDERRGRAAAAAETPTPEPSPAA